MAQRNRNKDYELGREIGELSNAQKETASNLLLVHGAIQEMRKDMNEKHKENAELIQALTDRIIEVETWRRGINYVLAAIGVVWTALLGWIGLSAKK